MQRFRYIRCTPSQGGLIFLDFPALFGSVTRARVFNQEIFNRDGYKTGGKTHRPGWDESVASRRALSRTSLASLGGSATLDSARLPAWKHLSPGRKTPGFGLLSSPVSVALPMVAANVPCTAAKTCPPPGTQKAPRSSPGPGGQLSRARQSPETLPSGGYSSASSWP
jgi:hypothetical protein